MSCCKTPKPLEPDPAAPECGCGPAAPSCCGGEKAPAAASSSCCSVPAGRPDWLLWGSLTLVAAGIAWHFLYLGGPAWWHSFSHTTAEIMGKAWWGILAGIAAVGVIGRLPQELIAGVLGKGGTFRGILRATFAGVLLDLCNHGVLMVAAQLYRKGASPGQTLAFLVASPWNSLSLTLILAGLIGWKWMLLFTVVSMLIGIATGWIADLLVKRGKLPANPHSFDLPADFRMGTALRKAGGLLKPCSENIRAMVRGGITDSQMILRWIFFGIVLTGLLRAFVPQDFFAAWFGPTIAGLMLTLLATTLIEVCTEGSSPIAADLLTRAGAPGNAFAFLMAGAATDYTEMLVLRETTRSWKTALALPAITVPQVLFVGWLMNQAG